MNQGEIVHFMPDCGIHTFCGEKFRIKKKIVSFIRFLIFRLRIPRPKIPQKWTFVVDLFFLNFPKKLTIYKADDLSEKSIPEPQYFNHKNAFKIRSLSSIFHRRL